MCGIAGWLNRRADLPAASIEPILRGMTRALHHRGPDDSGTWIDADAGIALGHRRLSILDLSPLGHQPMTSACGRYVAVYNGEIYNFVELRGELERLGHRFPGTSDTAVVLAAIVEWGIVEALRRFNGMFALAVWDTLERRLHLARDRAGEKPLYYGRVRNGIAFASELKAFSAIPDGIGPVDRGALALFMRYGYVPAPYSIYENIHKLPPATLVTFTQGDLGPQPVPYWSARDVIGAAVTQNPFQGSSSEAIEELDVLLRDAVRMRMVADVPLGAFLSGGIDSSLTVAMMQAQSSRPVKTFTIGFRESSFNEADKAALVARHLGTEHTELYVSPKESMDVIPTLPALYDEPFADSSQIPTFLVSRLARRHVTVSLSGDAGDELFGGYKKYHAALDLSRCFGWMPSALRRELAAVILATPIRLLNLSTPLLPGVQDRYGRNGSVGDKLHKLAALLRIKGGNWLYQGLASHWLSPAALVPGAHEPRTILDDSERRSPVFHVISRMMYLDLLTYLPDDILVKVDRAAMAVSLETRIPFLDPRIVEFAWRLPLDMKVRQNRGKWILRQLLGKYVPPSLTDRPKTGFAVPMAAWLQGPLRGWAEDLLAGESIREEGYLDADTVRRMWHEHLSGIRNWQQPLWHVLMFQAWRSNTCTADSSRIPINVAC